jgi:hypothetical protein
LGKENDEVKAMFKKNEWRMEREKDEVKAMYKRSV